MSRQPSSTIQTSLLGVDSSEPVVSPHPYTMNTGSGSVAESTREPMRRNWLGQLAQMLRKSALIKKRRRRATMTEVGYPAYFMLILWAMARVLPESVHYPEVQQFPSVDVKSPGALTCLWEKPDGGGSIPGCSTTGSSPNQPTTNGTWAGDITLGYVNSTASTSILARKAASWLGAKTQGYPSAGAMDAHAVALQTDGSHQDAYLFYGVEFAPDGCSYTIRFMPQPPGVGVPPAVAGTVSNADECRPLWKRFVWNTSGGHGAGEGSYVEGDSATQRLKDVLPSSCTALQYLTDGFVALQVALDRAVMQSKLGETTDLQVEVEPLPRIEFQTNFASANFTLRSIFSIYMVLALTSPVRWMITFLVEEKDTKVKEGMLMMGLHYSVFWACWGLTYVVVYGIVAMLCTIFLVVTGLLTQTSPLVVFLLIWSFGISTIPFSFAVSTFISNVRTGGPLASMFVSLMSLPFMAVVAAQGSEDALTHGELMWTSLVSPLAFCLGMDVIWTFDGGFGGFEGMNFANIHIPGPLGVSVLESLVMLWVDTAWLALLALYLDAVVPQEFGSQLPPHFLCLKPWWQQRYKMWFSKSDVGRLQQSHSLLRATADATADAPHDDCAREPFGETGSKTVVVQLDGVTKIFRKNWLRDSDDDTLAVDHVNLSLTTGEIFGLLGHNGAGKTTLMGIMTGLHTPTSGRALINGYDCVEDMTAIRQGLGVCPQHDILYDDLTVFEHVRLFASIKGVAASQIQTQAEEWLGKVGLMEKLNAMTNTLSGGQKRRLSCALAMIGDPSVVILDEPTTGLDPAARREVWECLKEARQDRLIILSTHFMDEADLLADRKAIIAHGKLRCVGSSLFLKSHFGLGYSLELTKVNPGSTAAEPIQQLIRTHVPSATLAQETPTALEFTLPLDAVPKFSALLAELESHLATLQCKSYGISAGSLASVFMRFADGGDLALSSTSTIGGRPADLETTFVDIDGPLRSQVGEDLSARSQLKAMIHAKFLITKQNKRAYIFAMFLPLLLIYLSATVGRPGPAQLVQDEKLTFSPATLGGSITTLPIAVSDNAQGFVEIQKWLQDSTGLSVVCYDGSTTVCAPASESELRDRISADYLTSNEKRASWRGVVLFDSTAVTGSESGEWRYTVLYSLLEVHALPTFINLVDEAILQSADAKIGDLQTSSCSFAEGNDSAQSFAFSGGGIFVAIALAAPATTMVAFVVRDKELKTRHQLSVMGLPSQIYWLGLFIHDCTLYSVPALGSIVINIATGVEPMGKEALGPYTALICLFVPAVVLFSYILSFMYQKHLLVYQTVPLLMQLSSIGAYMAVMILSMIPSTKAAATTVNSICTYLLPHYTVIGASTFMQQQYLQDTLTGQHSSYWENDQVQLALRAYLIMIPVYFGVLVALDRLKSCSRSASSDTTVSESTPNEDVDSDVQVERERAMGGDGSTFSIVARKLRKTYNIVDKDKSKGKRTLMAVNDLSLTVSEGECLGLLGPNGAGKTTTIRMLTAEETIGAGEALVNGFDVGTQAHKCWQSLGFCPQHDALWPELTTREHLELYARVKCAPRGVAEHMLKTLDLADHADKPSKDLSGGNRRKLSAAIALVSRPKVSFLDEPSSGMDVATRQHMWKVILSSLQHSCVVLTTHSMEEADALSTRIAIMTNGKMRCIGTSQELKAKFGQGYQLEVQLRSTATVDAVVRRVKDSWGGEVAESFGSRLKFTLPPQPGETQVASRLFGEVEKMRDQWNLAEYSISQPSLEMIFLKFAQDQRAEEPGTSDP